MAKKTEPCKRPYELGKRSENSDRSKVAVLKAARAELEERDFSNLTMEALARASGVSRQTVHNLFGTKTGVLEALFDQIAQDGGVGRMAQVMQLSNSEAILREFVKVFTEFWAADRTLLRRIHGIAAIDRDFGSVVEARNKRRKMAARRVVERLGRGMTEAMLIQSAAVLYAMTSFEFFDVLFAVPVEADKAAEHILQIVLKTIF